MSTLFLRTLPEQSSNALLLLVAHRLLYVAQFF